MKTIIFSLALILSSAESYAFCECAEESRCTKVYIDVPQASCNTSYFSRYPGTICSEYIWREGLEPRCQPIYLKVQNVNYSRQGSDQ